MSIIDLCVLKKRINHLTKRNLTIDIVKTENRRDKKKDVVLDSQTILISSRINRDEVIHVISHKLLFHCDSIIRFNFQELSDFDF